VHARRDLLQKPRAAGALVADQVPARGAILPAFGRVFLIVA